MSMEKFPNQPEPGEEEVKHRKPVRAIKSLVAEAIIGMALVQQAPPVQENFEMAKENHEVTEVVDYEAPRYHMELDDDEHMERKAKMGQYEPKIPKRKIA